jgi:hypothetical protein
VFKILGPAFLRKDIESLGRYLGHFNSWDGLLGIRKNNQIFFEPAFSWKTYLHIPKKIKNMLCMLKDIEHGNIEPQKNFRVTREKALLEIKKEIWVQCTNYFTAYNMFLLHRYTLNRVKKEDREQQKKSPYPSRVDKMEPYLIKEAEKWCEKIKNLKKGTSFSIAGGSSNHAVYKEFKKQEDGNFTRTIYNLGAGKELHSITRDHKFFPHVVTDISKEHFREKNGMGVKYLTSVLFFKLMLWVDKTRDMIYDNTLLKGSAMWSTDDLIPQNIKW